MKILGCAGAQIKKVKRNFLYREAAKAYKRSGTAQSEAATTLKCLHC